MTTAYDVNAMAPLLYRGLYYHGNHFTFIFFFSIESVSEKPKSKSPPVALHTVELLRACSSRLHISPKQAMDIAERLYTEVSDLLL